MVNVRHPAHGIALVLALIGLLPVQVASAAVTAEIDRPRIESNETFTLKITVDSADAVSPDLEPLEEDFEVGQTSRLSEARIVNGNVTRSMSWTITLSPRRAGTLEIPPVRVGDEQSEALSIEVVEPAYEPPGEADVFITADIDYDETYVQAQVLYTIRIYRAVATRQPALRQPVFSGAEVLVELASDERSYQEILDGRAYNVVERVFAVFPQETGEVVISPARFEARVLRDGRITGRKTFESEAHSITVKPIPPLPPDYPDATWLPAKSVTLTDDWSRDPGELRAGEPISRDITISALGQIQTQLPVIEPPVVDGVNVYPDKPALSRELETGGIRGIRTDQYAIIGVRGGDVTLPAIELPWWDIDAGEWRVAKLPERTVTIIGAPGSTEPPPSQVEAPAPEAAPAPVTVTEVVHSDLWRRIAEILGVTWLLTLGAWWWTTRPRREERPPREVPIHRQQASILRDARNAALAEDAVGVRRALLEWAAMQWPEQPPRSVGELAGRVAEPLAGELLRLSRASYGAGEATWSGKDMASAIRTLKIREDSRAEGRGEQLPPLMPT
jgi:hypothetical protein